MEKEKTNEKSQGLSKVLGPMHIWALGVGIVLVGEFMGWNFTVAKGGSIGSVIALWTVAMLYVMIVMMNTEMGSVMPEAGGQYTMAKYMLGPLAAFNVGLMLVLEYAMLEAADVLVVGQILESLNPNVKALPFIILSLLVLTYMNYRGVYATLTLNFVITAVAFVTIFILLFSTTFPYFIEYPFISDISCFVFGINILSNISNVFSPLILIIPIPPMPGAVAIPTIVLIYFLLYFLHYFPITFLEQIRKSQNSKFNLLIKI